MQKRSRRAFIGSTGKAAVAAGLVTFADTNTTPMSLTGKFIHHVYFWLKNKDSKEDQQQLVEGLKKLSAAKTIREFHIGQPADTNRDVIDRSYSISWCLVFDNAADQASYQVDPIHLKFVEECSALWTKVVVYDSVSI